MMKGVWLAMVVWGLIRPLSAGFFPTGTSGGDASALLWRVTREGRKPFFLLGSIHLLPEDAYPLPGPVEEAFAGSDVLAVEADISGGKAMELARLLLERNRLPEGETLRDWLSPEGLMRLEERLKTLDLTVEALEGYKPWYVVMMMTQVEAMRAGMRADCGVDMHFLQERGSRPVWELESAEFQIRLLDGFSREEQQAFLDFSLNDPTGSIEGIRQMVRFWRTGDIRSILNLFQQEEAPAPLKQVSRRLIEDRNHGMADKVDLWLRSRPESVFVVVGAAHLLGEEGVVSLLRQKGWTVEGADPR